MPKSDRSRPRSSIETPVGSVARLHRAARRWRSTRYLQQQPEVELTYTTIGGAQQNNAVNKGQIYVKLMPKARPQAHPAGVRGEFCARVLPRFQGVTASRDPDRRGGRRPGADPAQPRGPGSHPPPGDLRPRSRERFAACRDWSSSSRVSRAASPSCVVDVNRDLAADVGLSVGAIGAALRPVLAGQKAGDWEDQTGLVARRDRAAGAGGAHARRRTSRGIPLASSRSRQPAGPR